MFRLLLSFPLSPCRASSHRHLVCGPSRTLLNLFFCFLFSCSCIREYSLTVIHHHRTRVCSVIRNYLVAIFVMQFSGGCMIGWWCQGQVRKQQYFQHGEGLLATFPLQSATTFLSLSEPSSQSRKPCDGIRNTECTVFSDQSVRRSSVSGLIDWFCHFGAIANNWGNLSALWLWVLDSICIFFSPKVHNSNNYT